MNTLERSLSLIDKFYQDTPRTEIDELFAEARSMFKQDVFMDEYLDLMNASFNIRENGFDSATIASEAFAQGCAEVMTGITPSKSNLSDQYTNISSCQLAA